MVTKVVKFNKEKYNTLNTIGFNLQKLMRTTHLKDWRNISILNDRLSGTNIKNNRIGMSAKDHLKEEALCQVLGYGFEMLPTTYITFNVALSEGDCHPITEVGWHVDRLLSTKIFDEDIYEVKYIIISDSNCNIIREGIGVIMKQTNIQWIPNGNLVFSILTEYDKITKSYLHCINPF